ncbi:MAG TPA: hypothetical protein DEQ00_19445, partial [Mycobacterium tuberculosis]|nr:hypothetical protein [Mycobacterium tuberculosis]
MPGSDRSPAPHGCTRRPRRGLGLSHAAISQQQSVAAAVALMDLGRGFHEMAGNPHTTWVLYAVIVVSALVIVGAIPVLLR